MLHCQCATISCRLALPNVDVVARRRGRGRGRGEGPVVPVAPSVARGDNLKDIRRVLGSDAFEKMRLSGFSLVIDRRPTAKAIPQAY